MCHSICQRLLSHQQCAAIYKHGFHIPAKSTLTNLVVTPLPKCHRAEDLSFPTPSVPTLTATHWVLQSSLHNSSGPSTRSKGTMGSPQGVAKSIPSAQSPMLPRSGSQVLRTHFTPKRYLVQESRETDSHLLALVTPSSPSLGDLGQALSFPGPWFPPI